MFSSSIMINVILISRTSIWCIFADDPHFSNIIHQ
jgi:hypothetical protein